MYRAISFIGVAIVGWLVFLAMFRHRQHESLEYDVEVERSELDQLRERDPGSL